MLICDWEEAVEAGAVLLFIGMDWAVWASFPLSKMAQSPPASTKTPAQAPRTQYFLLSLKLLIEPSL